MLGERLQTVLARAGLGSRRAADRWIADGRVTVNGTPATPGTRVDVSRDRVTFDGRPVTLQAPGAVHLAIHKPRGVVSSAAAARGRPAVVDLVHPRPPGRLWPAGRLDVESEGLMLLTNDGSWAQRVLHPRYGIQREYAVQLDRMPAPDDLERLLTGFELEDGPARLLSAAPTRRPRHIEIGPEPAAPWLMVRVGEGRKREVRRLFAAVGYRVHRLVRTAIGPVTLAGLAPGAWRPLNAGEVAALSGTAQPGPRSGRAAGLQIAVDGTSGSGKSTVGRALADRIGARLVDTGLLYRAVALAALEAGIDPNDEAALARLARAADIHVQPADDNMTEPSERVTLDGRDVTAHLREPRIERAVPAVSRHAAVRQAMLKVQRDAARGRDTVMVGRDIGTVVLPDADLKVFLTASADTRTRRRAAQMGRPDRLAAYRREIEDRDHTDMTRPVAPLRRAEGALVLDTGELDVDACVDAIIAALGPRAAP
ncbi:MAG: (d)CMP kinase [Chloroflexota bacterium]